MILCKYPGCRSAGEHEGYCLFHYKLKSKAHGSSLPQEIVVEEKKTVKQKRIQKVSKKRTEIQRKQLTPLKKQLIKKHGDKCMVKSPVCIGHPCYLQHNRGRIGDDNLTNPENIILSCNPCNTFIEDNPQWAKERGFKLTKHEVNYKRKK